MTMMCHQRVFPGNDIITVIYVIVIKNTLQRSGHLPNVGSRGVDYHNEPFAAANQPVIQRATNRRQDSDVTMALTSLRAH
jgi:hypothetical protein